MEWSKDDYWRSTKIIIVVNQEDDLHCSIDTVWSLIKTLQVGQDWMETSTTLGKCIFEYGFTVGQLKAEFVA